MRRLIPAASWLLLSAFSCTVDYYADYEDVQIPLPTDDQLEQWQKEYEQGDRWRGDPKQVADRALRTHLDVLWKYRPYNAGAYELKNDRPEWGPYVVRGFYTRDQKRRYRVKLRRHKDVWYAIEVGHYSAVELPHPALEKTPDD